MGSALDKTIGARKRQERELAELSALADNSLDPARRAEAEARIAASPQLRALYERERQVVQLLRDAGIATASPAALRARITAQREPQRPAFSGSRRMGPVAALLAAAAITAVVVWPGGERRGPSLGQAIALASRGAVAPASPLRGKAPSPPLHPGLQDVYFPNWSSRFGWRAVGQRSDRLEGRLAVTMYYAAHDGRQIAYTIIAAPPLPEPPASVSRLEGVELRTLTLDGRLIVTWRRSGHTCLLSSVDVPPSTLRRLAASRAPGLDRA